MITVDLLSARSVASLPYPQWDDLVNGWKLIAIAIEGDFCSDAENDARDDYEPEHVRLGRSSASLGAA